MTECSATDKREALKLISRHLEAADQSLRRATEIADEHGVAFKWQSPYGCDGVGYSAREVISRGSHGAWVGSSWCWYDKDEAATKGEVLMATLEQKRKAQGEIAEKLKKIYAEIKECEKIALENEVEFSFSLGYGMGGTFVPKSQSHWDSSGCSEEWQDSGCSEPAYEEVQGEWLASSQSC